MYVLQNKISDVTAVKAINQCIYTNISGRLIRGEEVCAENVETSSFWSVGESIFYHDLTGAYFILDENKEYEIPDSIFPESYLDHKVICQKNMRVEGLGLKWDLGLLALDNVALEKTFEIQSFSVCGVINTIAVGHYEKDTLSAFNINSGEILWKLDLKEIGADELIQFIGIYENQAIVACKNHYLISVDIKTGEIVRIWRELKGFSCVNSDLMPKASGFVIDKENAQLISLYSKYYFEVDLISGDVEYWNLQDQISQHGIRLFRSYSDKPFTNQHIFTSAHAELDEFPGVDLGGLVAVNRKTKKIDWSHIFTECGLGTNAPVISDTHLYQRDLNNTLYIFEKE